MTWQDIKTRGSDHYKNSPDEVEPIDLYKSGGMLQDFAVCSGIKYLYRNRLELGKPINPNDIKKVIHYCEMLLFLAEQENDKAIVEGAP